MFEVTGYDHPDVYVKCRRTAETYHFEIGSDGSLTHKEARYDQGAARRARWLSSTGSGQRRKPRRNARHRARSR